MSVTRFKGPRAETLDEQLFKRGLVLTLAEGQLDDEKELPRQGVPGADPNLGWYVGNIGRRQRAAASEPRWLVWLQRADDEVRFSPEGSE